MEIQQLSQLTLQNRDSTQDQSSIERRTRLLQGMLKIFQHDEEEDSSQVNPAFISFLRSPFDFYEDNQPEPFMLPELFRDTWIHSLQMVTSEDVSVELHTMYEDIAKMGYKVFFSTVTEIEVDRQQRVVGE